MTISQKLYNYGLKPLTLAFTSIFLSTSTIIISPTAQANTADTTITGQAPSNNSISTSPNPNNVTGQSGVTSTAPSASTTVTTAPNTSKAESTDNSKPQTSLPLSQPNTSDTAVLNWASEAAKSAYSYDFKNYTKQLQQLQPNFTSTGWIAFMNALNKSNNLNVVQDKKLVASATLTGKPTILEKKVRNGIYSWKIQVPLLATYENESKLIKQPLIVTMLVVRDNSPSGLGISHFVATIIPSSQPIINPTGGGSTAPKSPTMTAADDTTLPPTSTPNTTTPAPTVTTTTPSTTTTPGVTTETTITSPTPAPGTAPGVAPTPPATTSVPGTTETTPGGSTPGTTNSTNPIGTPAGIPSDTTTTGTSTGTNGANYGGTNSQ
jgi:intracellular multiplication protein IcmL